jgi:SpoVK/Ycf46/Vps4 family AAA+-type ATPase
MQHALDPAFMRRLRFVVQFPFPDAAARERIWRGIFPAATPLGELDFGALAQLNVTGGMIRNIAMLAAFAAAEDSYRVETRHVLAAVRIEYAKTGKPLTAAEIRGLT